MHRIRDSTPNEGNYCFPRQPLQRKKEMKNADAFLFTPRVNHTKARLACRGPHTLSVIFRKVMELPQMTHPLTATPCQPSRVCCPANSTLGTVVNRRLYITGVYPNPLQSCRTARRDPQESHPVPDGINPRWRDPLSRARSQ